MVRFFILALLGLFTTPAQSSEGQLIADKGELVLRLDDGRDLRGQDLVGATVVASVATGEQRIHIQSLVGTVVSDKPLFLYNLTVEDPSHASQNVCQPDIIGRQAAIPLMKNGHLQLTCTSGAEGKCILLGYRPWETRADVSMQELHEACIHMIRADYGGDDHPTTRDGTEIDVYDRIGLQKPSDLNPMPLEAAWGRDGAICVAHPRIADHITLSELERRYPRLKGHLGATDCTEESVKNDPRVLLFNRSKGDVRS